MLSSSSMRTSLLKRAITTTAAAGLLVVVLLIADAAAGPLNLTGEWLNPADNSAFQLKSSADGRTLTATWHGAPGPHASLVGSFTGTLNQAGDAFDGTLHITEGTNIVNGTMTMAYGSLGRFGRPQ